MASEAHGGGGGGEGEGVAQSHRLRPLVVARRGGEKQQLRPGLGIGQAVGRDLLHGAVDHRHDALLVGREVDLRPHVGMDVADVLDGDLSLVYGIQWTRCR